MQMAAAAKAKAKVRHFLLLLLGLGWMGWGLVLVSVMTGTGYSNSRMYMSHHWYYGNADDGNKKKKKNRCTVPILKDYDEKSVSTFMQRLDILLPVVPPPTPTDDKDSLANRAGNASHANTTAHLRRPSCRLFVEEIADIERQLLQFRIPRPITVQIPDREYVSIQIWRWLFHDQHRHDGINNNGQTRTQQQQQCPNCLLHFGTWATSPGNESTTFPDHRVRQFASNAMQHDQIMADAVLEPGCPRSLPTDGSVANRSAQVLIGGCGESQVGSGRAYATSGRKVYDYTSGFYDMHDGSPFVTTYAHGHFGPDADANRTFGLQEIWSVTDFARQLLTMPQFPRYRRSVHGERDATTQNATAMFVHNNCQGMRGKLLKGLAELERRTGVVRVARYGSCLHNAELPSHLKPYDDTACAVRKKEHFFHSDCEATRDSTKTLSASLHDFTFSLENTLSEDYFTEKRWQALLAGSVPIVWNNHNSEEFLPDPDSAILVDAAEMEGSRHNDVEARLMDDLAHYAKNRTAYMKFFAWKSRGLTPTFVRKLFLSTDYLVCRICEFVAHTPTVPL